MATIIVNWIITLKDCMLLFCLLLLSNLSIVSIQSVLISKDLWGLAKWLSNYIMEEISHHICGFELSKSFFWLSRERKRVLKARNISPSSHNIWWADRDVFTPPGTYVTQQLPVAAALHSRKTHFFQARTIGDEWKHPSDGEEYAELLFSYKRARIDPTIAKFLIFAQLLEHTFLRNPNTFLFFKFFCTIFEISPPFITYIADYFFI